MMTTAASPSDTTQWHVDPDTPRWGIWDKHKRRFVDLGPYDTEEDAKTGFATDVLLEQYRNIDFGDDEVNPSELDPLVLFGMFDDQYQPQPVYPPHTLFGPDMGVYVDEDGNYLYLVTPDDVFIYRNSGLVLSADEMSHIQSTLRLVYGPSSTEEA